MGHPAVFALRIFDTQPGRSREYHCMLSKKLDCLSMLAYASNNAGFLGRSRRSHAWQRIPFSAM